MENIKITVFSKDKELYCHTITPEEWYDGEVPEIDNSEYIKSKFIDKVKIIQDSKLNINYYNADGYANKFEIYNENNNLTKVEIVFRDEVSNRLNFELEITVGERINGIFKSYYKGTTKVSYQYFGDKECHNLIYEDVLEPLERLKEIEFSFNNYDESEQICIVKIEAEGGFTAEERIKL